MDRARYTEFRTLPTGAENRAQCAPVSGSGRDADENFGDRIRSAVAGGEIFENCDYDLARMRRAARRRVNGIASSAPDPATPQDPRTFGYIEYTGLSRTDAFFRRQQFHLRRRLGERAQDRLARGPGRADLDAQVPFRLRRQRRVA